MQPNLFTGYDLAMQGLDAAVINADKSNSSWSSKAVDVAFKFIAIHPKGFVFQVEDVREWGLMKGYIEQPPSLRAWGCIVRPMLQSKKVVKLFLAPVSNKQAHAANAMSYQIL